MACKLWHDSISNFIYKVSGSTDKRKKRLIVVV